MCNRDMQKRVVKLNVPFGRDGGESENSMGGVIAPLLPKFQPPMYPPVANG